MAQAVELKKGDTAKKGFVGFSWKTLFFNFLVPLFRKDWGGAGIMFAVSFAIAFVANMIAGSMVYGSMSSDDPDLFMASLGIAMFIPWITAIAVNIFWACKYNKQYTKKLLDNGFEPANDLARTTLKAAGLLSA